MSKLYLILFFFVVSGCTTGPIQTGPAPFDTETTFGKIISRKYNNDESQGVSNSLLPLPIGGGVTFIDFPTIEITPGTYMYSIKDTNGQIILTKSRNEIEVGECIRLWHPPLAPSNNKKYNFIAGFLEKSDKC